jgi:magnesium transporter
VHIVESLDSIRDLISGLLDIYLSTVSNRVNLEVRVLTVITTLFMPATLIAGIFGMNFHSMPWLDLGDGFFLALALMVVVAMVMALVFWRRRWLA